MTRTVLEDFSDESAADDNDDETYIVERILAERLNEDGVMKYLVSWEDYPDVSCASDAQFLQL